MARSCDLSPNSLRKTIVNAASTVCNLFSSSTQMLEKIKRLLHRYIGAKVSLSLMLAGGARPEDQSVDVA